MKFQPFRILDHEDPNNFSTVYEFIVQGSNKNPYNLQIHIDDFNDLGITDKICDCPDSFYRDKDCKHIFKALEILEEYKIWVNPKS